ncbi:MAG TPA: IPTL-CTERM sorting domain-containing protein [Thermodesulfobacteriota bacterium]|nr:IPTL-CTERM sorting domain-containing protein [Thermodesulfobacteriota bacterium]
MSALASLDDGRLVAAGILDDATSILVEINPITGQGTLIGVIGNNNNPGECARIPGLTYDSATDTLYGLARNCNGISAPLVTINPDTAEMTTIGPSGLSGGGFGLAVRDDGTLFAAVWNSEIFSLFTLNRDTGASTLVGTMDTSGITTGPLGVGGLAFHPVTQQLYASANNGDVGPTDSYLLTVDESVPPSFNVVGQTVDCFDGIAFAEQVSNNVPTLSEWGFIVMAGILGIAALLVLRRRRITA